MTKKVNIDIVARDKTKRAIDKSKKGLGGLKTAALAVTAALATMGAGRAISGLVNVGKEMESLNIRFKLLFGSAEEGAKAFDTLTSFAAKVPFSLGDIAAASGNLAVVAKDAKQLNDILEKGVRDMLGFSAGAKISVEETREAFAKVFAGDGEFANTTKELAKTLEGTLSMINDKFLAFQLAINKAFFAEIKKQFGDLDEFLAEREESIQSFGEAIGTGLAKGLKEAVETLDLLRAATELLDRSLEDATGSNEGFGSSLLHYLPGIREVAVMTGLFFDNNEKLAESLDSINPKIERKGLNLENLSARHSTLATTIAEETSPAITQLEQDVLDLEEALQPLGNAFDTAFKPLDDALEKHEEERKSKLQQSFQNFKDVKFKEIDFQKMTDKEAQQMTREGFRTALQEGAKHNRALFRINQAMNIANAIMNTATGVTEALKLGPIIGPPLALAIGAMGAVQVATIAAQQPPAQFGGARVASQPFLVGEKGPELFTPAHAGTVTPNHQLDSAPTHIVFNINTVDAKGFGALLDTRKAQIVNMINSARNQKGQSNIV